MRDILTVLAGLLILVLTAAVAAPPFVDWAAHRAVVEAALARTLGAPVRTDGAVTVRLLPTPRIRVERVRMGEEAGPSLAAADLSSELSLGALMRGEVRLLDGAMERAEIRVPVTPEGRLQLPALDEGSARIGFEGLSIGQLVVTAVTPRTGRTDQVHAEGVRVTTASLVGPWRVEGRSGGAPFRIVSGLPARDGAVPVRATGGGGAIPRFDLDLRALFARGPDGLAPTLAGTARLAFGPPVQEPETLALPVTVQAEIRATGRVVELEGVQADLGEGPQAPRLTGTGRLDLDAPALALALEGRRLDLDALLATPGGGSLRERLTREGLPRPALPVTLDLALGSVALAREELSGVRLSGRLSREGARLSRLDATAPGQTVLSLVGEGEGGGGGFAGQARIASRASDRFGLFLTRLGVTGPLAAALSGPPFEAEAGVNLSPPVLSLRNLRVEAGGAALTGALRYAAAEGTARARLDAQIATQGLDLADLPRLDRLVGLGEAVDLGLTLQARDVRYRDAAGGRILARLASDGTGLRVEELRIENLAGAEARVTGRVGPDGSGRLEGRVQAARAAPLVEALRAVMADAPLDLLPAFLREGAVDLALEAERGRTGLRASLKGSVAGGPFEAETQQADGATQSLRLALQTPDATRWLAGADPLVAGRPASVAIRGTRTGAGRFAVTAEGDLAGLRLATARPFAYLTAENLLDAGEATLSTADLRPALLLLGGAATAAAPVPADLRLSLARAGNAASLQVGGRIAGEPVQARVAGASLADLSGEATLASLSLPWLVQTLGLGPVAEPVPGALWAGAPFAPAQPSRVEGRIGLRVARLDLGRGLEAREARFTLAVTRDGVAVRDLAARLAGGQIAGTLALTRQGPRASLVAEGSVADVVIPEIAGPGAPAGRLTADIAVGGAGETPLALMGNLAGEGRLAAAGLELPSASAGAVRRTLDRALAESDPLNPRRLADALDGELARGPFRAPEASASATVVGGVVRINPLNLSGEDGAWAGALSLDLRTLGVDARGQLVAAEASKAWTGPPPAVALAWRGPLRALRRESDPGPLTNGLAAIVLQRELERIELFEMEANERARLQGRLGLDRQRREDARRAAEDAARRAQEEAARRAIEERRAAEEAARRAREAQIEAERQARLRAQAEAEAARRAQEEAVRRAAEERRAAERQRQEAEAARRAQEDAAALRRLIDGSGQPAGLPEPPPPIDLRPPAGVPGLR